MTDDKTDPAPIPVFRPNNTWWDTLVIEMLSEIFSFLSYQDLRSARMVCHQWHLASLAPNLTDREQIVIECLCQKEQLMPAVIPMETYNFLKRSERTIMHLVIKGSSVEWCDERFFQEVGNKLRSLTLWPTIGSKEDLFKSLQHCPNLKYLSIRIENIFFSLVGVANLSDWTYPDLLKLERLELHGITHFNLGVLQIMLLTTPNLQSFLVKRSEAKPLDSRAILDSIDCLKENTDRAFDVEINFFDDVALSARVRKRVEDANPNVSLCILRTHLLSRPLVILSRDTLKELVLSSRVDLANAMLELIASQFVNLEKLDCNLLLVTRVPSFSQLVKLKSLTLRMMFKVSEVSLIEGLCSEVNETLTEVFFEGQLIGGPKFIIAFARTHPAVTSLTFQHCTGLNSLSVQAIFKYQTKLQTLRIPFCRSVTATGLAGRLMLGHRGIENPTGHSIARLTELRLLDLYGCDNKLDSPLPTLQSLKDISVAKTGISWPTLLAFIRTHRGLRNINLSGVPLDDSVLRKIVQELPELETVVTEDCPGLTEEETHKLLSQREISRSCDLWSLTPSEGTNTHIVDSIVF